MKNRTNLLIIAPDFYPNNSGYSNAITNFVQELNKQDINIFVYTPVKLSSNLEIDLKNVKIFRFCLNKFFLATIIWEIVSYFKISKIIREKKIDAIFFETGELGLLGYLISRKFKNVLVRIHACTETEVAIFGKRLYDKFHSFFIKLFFRKVKWILSTNKYHINFYKRHFLKNDIYKIANKKFFIIPNIVQIEASNQEINKTRLFNKYSIEADNNTSIIFSLGRLNYIGLIQKGLEDLIYAIYFLSTDSGELLDNTKIVIVGDGEFKNYISQLIEKLNIRNYFVFLDRATHEDVFKFIKISKGVVLLSRFEGLSMFALEALANGAPLIFSNSGGIRDLVRENVNGYLVEPQNVEMIKSKIELILKKNELEINQMRKQSESIFISDFSPKIISDRFMKIINLIISS